MKLDELPWRSNDGDSWEYIISPDKPERVYMARSLTKGANIDGILVPIGTVVFYGIGERGYEVIDSLTAECLAIEYLKSVTQEVTP